MSPKKKYNKIHSYHKHMQLNKSKSEVKFT